MSRLGAVTGAPPRSSGGRIPISASARAMSSSQIRAGKVDTVTSWPSIRPTQPMVAAMPHLRHEISALFFRVADPHGRGQFLG